MISGEDLEELCTRLSHWEELRLLNEESNEVSQGAVNSFKGKFSEMILGFEGKDFF